MSFLSLSVSTPTTKIGPRWCLVARLPALCQRDWHLPPL